MCGQELLVELQLSPDHRGLEGKLRLPYDHEDAGFFRGHATVKQVQCAWPTTFCFYFEIPLSHTSSVLFLRSWLFVPKLSKLGKRNEVRAGFLVRVCYSPAV